MYRNVKAALVLTALSMSFSVGALAQTPRYNWQGIRGDLVKAPIKAPVKAPVKAPTPAPAAKGKFKPSLHIRPSAAKPGLGSGPLGGYSLQQIRQAYTFNQYGGTGKGQVIAIVDAFGSPTIQADLAKFSAQFGIPSGTLKVFYPQGQPFFIDFDWAMETSLDVEWAHAIAPGAEIWLIVTADNTVANLLAGVDYATQLGAHIVSMSFGGPEFAGETGYDFHFSKKGVSFVASSGDAGAGVEYPAVAPNVLAVGGTTLNLNSKGDIISETAWAWDPINQWGGGGGVSAFEKQPPFQSGWQSTGMRTVPDVAYNGDPYTGFPVYISVFGFGEWEVVGGTSAGAPQWAALIALANSSRQITNVAQYLYLMADENYHGFFRDITVGNNNGYNSVPNLDQVTGLGSPHAALIALVLGAY